MSNDVNRGDDLIQDAVSSAVSKVSPGVQAAKDSNSDMLADASDKVKRVAQDAQSAANRLVPSGSPQSPTAKLRFSSLAIQLAQRSGHLQSVFWLVRRFGNLLQNAIRSDHSETLIDSAKATATELVEHGTTAVVEALTEARGATAVKGGVMMNNRFGLIAASVALTGALVIGPMQTAGFAQTGGGTATDARTTTGSGTTAATTDPDQEHHDWGWIGLLGLLGLAGLRPRRDTTTTYTPSTGRR